MSPRTYYPAILFAAATCMCSSAVSADSQPAEQQTDARAIEVHKSPTCGCCKNWMAHLQQSGFNVSAVDHADLFAVKMEAGVKEDYQSCHTAIIDGYAFEGHVPAKFITQFLQNPASDAIGLSVPGMPAGSPGMEMGERFTPYSVMLLKRDGTAEVYARIDNYRQQF